jgi:hypothetical protein
MDLSTFLERLWSQLREQKDRERLLIRAAQGQQNLAMGKAEAEYIAYQGHLERDAIVNKLQADFAADNGLEASPLSLYLEDPKDLAAMFVRYLQRTEPLREELEKLEAEHKEIYRQLNPQVTWQGAFSSLKGTDFPKLRRRLREIRVRQRDLILSSEDPNPEEPITEATFASLSRKEKDRARKIAERHFVNGRSAPSKQHMREQKLLIEQVAGRFAAETGDWPVYGTAWEKDPDQNVTQDIAGLMTALNHRFPRRHVNARSVIECLKGIRRFRKLGKFHVGLSKEASAPLDEMKNKGMLLPPRPLGISTSE